MRLPPSPQPHPLSIRDYSQHKYDYMYKGSTNVYKGSSHGGNINHVQLTIYLLDPVGFNRSHHAELHVLLLTVRKHKIN